MAITFDAQSEGTVAGGTATCTVAHTCTGSNRIIYIGIMNQNTGALSTITYNGVAATLVSSVTHGTDVIYLYRLVAPATGSNNIVVTRGTTTGSMWVKGVSYAGVDQSSPSLDIDTTDPAGTITTNSVTTTPTVSSAWAVMFTSNLDGGTVTATNSNLTVRNATVIWNRFLDTNGGVADAARALSATKASGGSGFPAIVEAIRPATAGIGYGAVTTGSSNNSATVSFSSPTVAGTNTLGVVTLFVQTDLTITGVTWNGVAMTFIGGKTNGISNERIEMWYIINPAAGSTTVTATRSGGPTNSFQGVAAFYTGVKQSSQPDASITKIQGSGTTLSTSLTTVADNCWAVLTARNAAGNFAASTNTVFRSGLNQFLADNNGPISPAGAYAMDVTLPNTESYSVMASFAPVASAAGPANLKTYNTNLKANIKTIDTNAIANVKTLDTNA